jgi:hypothetical protein
MAVILSVAVLLIARFIISRGLVYLSKRTGSKYDDIVVEHLRPFRFAWLAPLLLICSSFQEPAGADLRAMAGPLPAGSP